MKICHLTSVHGYRDIRISIKECKSLLRANYDVHLIAPNTDVKVFEGINVHGIKNNYKGRIKRISKFTSDIYKNALEINADVYHFHDPELIPIGLKLKRMGKKVIYDVHEDVPRQILSKYWIPKVFRKVVSFLFEKYENYSAKKFDCLVTATPYINIRFIDQGCNSININNYPILKELYTVEEKRKKENSVAYVGGISVNRGIEKVVSSMENVNAGFLCLAGNFRSVKEHTDIAKRPGWDKVKYLGQIDRNEVKEVLNRSIAGIVLFLPLPNHVDAQPNKMFEYMSAEVCVIASNFPLWREIIEGNNCGICVDPTNVGEISSAIQWVIDNPEKAKEMGKNGRKAVENKYNWELESTKLLELYRNVAK